MKKLYFPGIAFMLFIFLYSSHSIAQNVNTNAAGPGTSTVPANAVSATVEIWGAGGGGGGSNSNNDGGSGGGGGGYSLRTFVVLPGQLINYTVGAGGNAGAPNGNQYGEPGGNTNLNHGPSGTNMIANGGAGGRRNQNPVGIGGTATGGTTNLTGQNGGNGGGGTGGDGGDAGNAPGTGGNGNTNGNGDAGASPGGGGGGGEAYYHWFWGLTTYSGGNGANGRVIITYTIVPSPTITNFTPNNACAGSGSSITINGTNFNGATNVSFNGISASFSVLDNTTITATLPAGATTGAISVTTPAGTASSATNFTVHPSPATIVGGAATVCTGDSTPAFTNAAAGGTWSIINGTGSATINASGVVTGVSQGSATVVYTLNPGSCSTSTAITVLGTPGPIGGGAATVCEGDSTPAFTNSVSGGTWSVANGTGSASIDASGVVTGISAGSATIIYTIGSCTQATTSITVNTTPVAITGGAASVCTGSDTPAFTNATTGGTWSIINDSGTASISAAGIVTGLSAGNVRVVYTIGSCSAEVPLIVYQTPGIITGGDSAVCINDDTTAFTNSESGGTWSIVNGTGTATINPSGVVTGVSAGTVTVVYTIGSCQESTSLTVNDIPTIGLSSATSTTNQTLCINTGLTDITYTIGGAATGASVSGLPTGLSGVYSSGIFTISGTPSASGVFNYTVTTNGGLCPDITETGTITVEALPTATLSSAASTDNQTLCIYTAMTDITYAIGGSATNATVSGLPAGVTGSFGSGVFTISGTPTVAGTYNYTVTTAGGSCAATTATGIITVNPLPADPGIITGPSAVCQGQNGVTYSVPTIADATGYIWTLPSGASIVGGANTNSIVVNFDVTATSGAITVQGSNACGTGNVSANFNVTVNITPYIPNNYSIAACSGETATLTPSNGGGNIVPPGTTYSWGLPTVTGGMTGATSLSGQTNFNQTLINPTNIPQTASYNVTATTAGCSASTFSVVVTVNPTPAGSASPSTQTVCANASISTINLSETTGISGTIDYSWTRNNTGNVGGMSASGTGNTISGTFTNTTNSPQTTTFTVIATSEYGCDSIPFTVSVTVNPTPTVAATPNNQTICSGDAISPINLSNPNNVSGVVTYSWTRNNTGNITGIPNGSGSSISGTLTNTTNIAQTTTFTVTAYANGCPSATTSATVTVNPRPTVAVSTATQTVCGGSAITPITISNPNNVSGTIFSWTRNNTTNLTGMPNSGSGNTISGTLVNTTNTNQTAIFTVRATSGSCYTETTTQVVVRPTPLVVATPSTQTICNNSSFNISLSNSNGSIAGTSYSWTRNNTSNVTGVATSGSGSTISGTLVNTTTSTQTVTFNITATANGCSSTTTATVTVYAPLVAPVIGNSQDVCNLQSPSDLFMTTVVSGGSGSYQYRWERSNNGTTGWANAPGASTNTTYSPPNNEGYYRLRITDAICGTVLYSNVIVINYIGLGGIFDSISATNLPGTVCSGSSINPGVNIEHSLLSTVDFTYSATSTYVTPSSGTITNPIVTPIYAWIFHVGNESQTNIPLTVQNNTNATVVTQLYVAPIFDNGFGTCTADAIAIPITIRPVPVASASVPFSTFCSGTSAGIQVQGNITDAPMQFSWTRTGATGVTGPASGNSGNIAAGNIYTIPNTLSNSSTVTRDITYTITPTSNGCPGAPITITVTVAPNVTPGTIAASQTICNGGDPTAFTQTVAATGLNLSYQWQLSTTNASSGFSDIAGATGITYDALGPITQNTWYRRITTSTVNGITCSSAPSNAVQITINNIDPGSINGDQTVCSVPGDPSTLGNAAHATQSIGGSTGRSYQWQSTTVGCGAPDGSWNIITGATGPTYNPPPGLVVTTYYRRIVTFSTGGGCSEVSNCVTVYVNNVTGGIIGNDQTICDNNPSAFVELTPSTGSGTLTYQWQSSTDNVNFTDISGATNFIYDAPPGVTVTTYYRRLTISTLNGVSCNALSNVVTVTSNGVSAGTIEGNRTVCSGGDPAAFTVTASATGSNLTYQWQSSTISGAGPWNDITGATDPTYDVPSGITQTTYYHRIVTSSLNGNTCSATSNFVVVFVNDVDASTISGNQTVCSIDNPAAFTVSTGASGSGTVSYQWQSSTTSASGPWTNINFATNAIYDPPILAQTTWYQVIVTSTLNGINCSDISNTLEVTVSPYTTAVASNLTAITDCDDTTIQLSGNASGSWSAVSIPAGATFSFSNVNNPNATFTGESGVTYNITWTLDNPMPCADDSDTFTVVFPNCGNFIDFDGTNDYVDIGNHFNASSAFSIEAWVKRDDNSNSLQTILSKRDDTTFNSGYDLSINNGNVIFRWNTSGSIQSPQPIDNSRWYHIAITFESGTYRMYIDGIQVATASGSSPSSNTHDFVIGAMGRSNNTPTNYFNGSLDEIRVWNTALDVSQVREMMNQEIENNGGNVQGSILEMDIVGLTWPQLVGYYQMNQASDIGSGLLTDISSSNFDGNLNNMTSLQAETAPIPYISAQNGNWNTASTWQNGSVQLIPNGLGIDGSPVNWNIVRTVHNIQSINQDLTLLGLLVDSNKLSIQNSNVNDGQSISISNYLKIDGNLDLVGESQLLMSENSLVDPTGTGVLERDQQGTTNRFNYNYWGSPVNSAINTFSIAGVLRDGSNSSNPLPLQWTNSYNSSPTSPLTISRRWLYTYENYPEDSYADWRAITENSPIFIGLGFTMKGSSAGGSLQNYTFAGTPNNGTITTSVTIGNQALIGNPYPSAIDGHEFIRDNVIGIEGNPGSTQSIDGSLYFWEQSPTNGSHTLSEYEGGYAVLNLSGANPAVAPTEINGEGSANKLPRRYIPVGQGFYVTASPTAGTIQFKNSQRFFVKESSGNSEFFRSSEPEFEDAIQRVRLRFKTSRGAVRPLMLAFTGENAATDNFDYGYDAENTDILSDDMSFMIGTQKYSIQGVGSFDVSKQYPLGIFVTNTGVIDIALTDLENFEDTVNVFIYDALLGSYHQINDTSFTASLEPGDYINRFYLTFEGDSTLDIIDQELQNIVVNYLQATDEVYIKVPNSVNVKQIYLINIIGQTVKSWNSTNMTLNNEMRIPIYNISEGSYVIQLQTDSGLVNKKIIINY